MTRTAAREVAVRLCFSTEMLEDSGIETVLEDFFEPEHYATLGREDELFAEIPNQEQMNYIRQMVSQVAERQAELDGYIAQYAKGWSVARISKVSRAILRCALYEILYMEDVPTKAAVNEAVEIAKHYEEPETVSFINGVLGSFIRGMQETP